MAKAKPASRRGRQKGEQQHLPEMAPAKDKDLHKLALEYVRARDLRQDQLKEEVELKDRLLALMEAKGLKVYEYEEVNVTVSEERTIKVKRQKEAEEE